MVVDILTGKLNPPPISSLGLIEPLLKNRGLFRDHGIIIRRVATSLEHTVDADLVLVDSKFLKPFWKAQLGSSLESIRSIKARNDRVFFCDSADSTGSVQAQVIPLVDRYLKAQVLRDKTQYLSPMYGGRLHTEFVHRVFGVVDKDEEVSQPLNVSDLKKLEAGWNVGLAGGYGKQLNALRRRIPHQVLGIHMSRPNRYARVGGHRSKDLLLRMTVAQIRSTIAWQRQRVQDRLSDFVSPGSLVSMKKYLREMADSKIVVSPFAWGEMSTKDFESFALGALLVKPDMSHMTTFPDFYQAGRTYVPVDWQLDELTGRIREVLGHYEDFLDIAAEGQRLLRYYSDDLMGRGEFVEHVSRIFEQKQEPGSASDAYR